MSNKIKLYPCFSKWEEFDSITILSDTHFDDEDVKEYRGNITSEEIVKNINKTCGKKSVFICLGDVGNVEWVKKIRGYKVLIKGNHDSGSSNYQRTKTLNMDDCIVVRDFEDQFNAEIKGYKKTNEYLLGEWLYAKEVDNHLFDEVYEGPLIINEKIILSHEPLDVKGMLNIHGHIHGKRGRGAAGSYHLNVCAEHVNYTPIRLNDIVEKGYLSKIDSIHRETIDKATDRKRKREKK